jgi:hypothetical protein
MALTNTVFYWQFGQYGGPGLLHRLSDEVGRRLAELGLDRQHQTGWMLAA